MPADITIRSLMASGVHFGHRSSRWNPKMKPYIYSKRNLVHIIDLRETVRNLFLACKYLTKVSSRGGEILFVGTKRQARSVVLQQARRTGMHYVNERWLGGTLTNFAVIRKQLKRLEELEDLETSGRIKVFSKKMQASLLRTKAKMLRNLEGIRKMKRLPNVLVIIDPGREKNARREARRLGIPTIAVVDTDCDPDDVDIPIPANDDAMRSISVLMEQIGDAVLEGVEKFKAHVGPIPERPGARSQDARPVPRRPAGRSEGGPGRRPGGKGGPGNRRGQARPGGPPPAQAKERKPGAPAPEASKKPAETTGRPSTPSASEAKSGSASGTEAEKPSEEATPPPAGAKPQDPPASSPSTGEAKGDAGDDDTTK